MAFAAFYDANVLIPHEIRDILMFSAAVERHNIEVQTPDQFVRHQAAFSPPRFMECFLARAAKRNRLSIARGEGTLSPHEIAEFLRDGPSNMPETGQYIIDLLQQYEK